MKYLAIIMMLLVSQSSCSSFSIQKNESLISLRDVEQIKLERDSRSVLEKNFGQPSKEHSIDAEYYVVVYDRPYPGKDFSAERASFVLLRNTDIVVSALWIPFGSEEKQTVDVAKAHFALAKFIIRNHPPSSDAHEGALDYSLDDRALGVSIDVIKQNERVSSISFGVPANRSVGSFK